MIDFGNVVTAMVTPFNSDYSINYDMAVEIGHYDIIKLLVDNGADFNISIETLVRSNLNCNFLCRVHSKHKL